MEILFVLLIVVTIVTVVGHTIWIVIAAFLRAVFADDVVIDDDPRQEQLKDVAITEDQISQ